MKNIPKKILLLISAASICTIGYAATDGNLGSSSTGSVDLSVTVSSVSDEIQITGLEDFNWGVVLPNSTISPIIDNTICVFRSIPGTYDISFATSQTFGADHFKLVGGVAPSISYLLQFADHAGKIGTKGPNDQGSGGIVSFTDMAASNTAGCSGEMASLTIDPNASPSGITLETFTETLTITVTPN